MARRLQMPLSMRHLPKFILVFLLLCQIAHAKEPNFLEIAKACESTFKLNPDFDQLTKRVRKAPWLPTLYAGYDHQTRQAQSLTIQDNVSIASGDITVGPSESNNDYDTSLGNVLRIRAVWRLDELVYSNNELGIIREKRSWTDQKRSILNDLYKIYEQRRLVLVQMKQAHSTQKRALLKEKAFTLTAHLDEMTGGKFMNRWNF